jgi:hypothetical protein
MPAEDTKWWRGPWLTKEDIRALNSLPPEKAKSFELLLHSQARTSIREDEHTIPLESIMASYGAINGVRERDPRRHRDVHIGVWNNVREVE